jgi:hypothetical protein
MLTIKNEYTFPVKIVGERSKKTYEGNFTVKCVLNYQEQINVGLLIDEYNRGSRTVPEATFRMNRALAELDIRILVDERTGNQKAPSWWRDSNGGRELIDKNVVLELFLKALDAETDFDKRIEEEGKEAEEAIEKQSKKAKTKEV